MNTGAPGQSAPVSAPPRMMRRPRIAGNMPVVVSVVTVSVLVLLGVVVAATRDSSSVPSGTAPVSTSQGGKGDSQPAGSGQLNDLIRTSIVQLLVGRKGDECAVGSGSVIGDDRHVLTNLHVVKSDDECRAERISVRVVVSAAGTPVEMFTGTVVASDDERDLAIIRLTPTVDTPAVLVPLSLSSSDEVGQDLTVVGFPGVGGDTPTVSRGILSGFVNIDGQVWMKTDAFISAGNSGGAALDASRHLIGVPTMYSESSDGELVDCRNVADTNGDGQVDEDDQCISLGGTIGLMAPVSAIRSLADSMDLAVAVVR